MRPTPELRPGNIYVSERIKWALQTISAGLRGNGPNAPELTRDGIADTLLTEAIEAKWPKLLDGFAQKESIDAEYQQRVADAVKLGAADARHDAAVLRAQKGQI